MASQDMDNLLTLLAKYSYRYKPEGFMLASGKVSNEYIDCKMALSHAEAGPWVAALILERADPRAIAVGGLTMGADPIAYATSLVSAGGRNLRWFSVRKESKQHGSRKLIEGDVPNGANVVIVDDVVTTGGSTEDAIQKARAERLNVLQVIVLVDREEDGGLERIQRAAGSDVSVQALFTKADVRREWERLQPTLRATA